MQLSNEGESSLPQQTGELAPGTFMLLPVNQIEVEDQIRSQIDTESESFKNLLASIRAPGVLEPILVRRRGAGFVLISGERRLRAAMMIDKID